MVAFATFAIFRVFHTTGFVVGTTSRATLWPSSRRSLARFRHPSLQGLICGSVEVHIALPLAIEILMAHLGATCGADRESVDGPASQARVSAQRTGARFVALRASTPPLCAVLDLATSKPSRRRGHAAVDHALVQVAKHCGRCRQSAGGGPKRGENSSWPAPRRPCNAMALLTICARQSNLQPGVTASIGTACAWLIATTPVTPVLLEELIKWLRRRDVPC